MCSASIDWPLRHLGCPIRTPLGRSLLGGSPRLIAACNVLHRLLAPRHPPYALCTLALKMLTLAMEFSRCFEAAIDTGSVFGPKKMPVTFRPPTASRGARGLSGCPLMGS